MNRLSKSMTVVLLVSLSHQSFADELHSIGFGKTASSWGVVSKSIYELREIPNAAVKKIKEITENGGRLRGIAFTPNGGWGLTYYKEDDERLYGVAQHVPQTAVDYINKCSQNGASILDMAFGPNNSWFVLTQKNNALKWKYRGVPLGLATYLDSLSGGDRILEGVGITSQSGWAVISKSKSGSYSCQFHGIPQGAINKLKDILESNDENEDVWTSNI